MGSWLTGALKGAATGGLGALATGGVSALFGIGSRKKAFNRSKQLMNERFKLDKQMWDYQNAYNTPKAQMERLKQAGLNPALMYGQGTTGNANQMPTSQFQQLDPYYSSADFAQSTAAGVQASMLGVNKENQKANTLLAKANAVIQGLIGEGMTMQKEQYFKSLAADYQSSMSDAALKELMLGMKQNGIFNDSMATVISLLSGQEDLSQPGVMNKQIEIGKEAAKKFGFESGVKMTVKQMIMAQIALIYTGKKGIDTLFSLYGFINKITGKKGNNTTVNRAQEISIQNIKN